MVKMVINHGMLALRQPENSPQFFVAWYCHVRIGLQFWLVEFCSNSSNINFCLDRSGEPSQLLRLISQFWWDVHIRSLTAGIAVAGSTTNDKPKMGVTKWLRFYIIYVFADNVWKSGKLSALQPDWRNRFLRSRSRWKDIGFESLWLNQNFDHPSEWIDFDQNPSYWSCKASLL